jgi:hypothetical protein
MDPLESPAMEAVQLSDQDLARFGVEPGDEGAHDHDPEVEWWNESWFWDWYDRDGEVAGHCRIGMHPNQHRLWVWFFLKHGDEWVGVEEPRLPLARFDVDRLAYDGWGLRFSWEVIAPIRRGRLRFEGFGRVLSGPRVGQMQAVSADLAVEAAGPPHAPGRMVAGHGSPKHAASRFEQPVSYRGTTAIADGARPFEGRGERDHSWGPRPWNMEWTFLVFGGARLRSQCAVVEIPNFPPIQTGYLYREGFESLAGVELDVEVEGRPVLDPVAGRCHLVSESGEALHGEIESLSGVEIDLSHVFTPPQRSLYRRALVRVRLDDEAEPLTGWLEFNRLRERHS